MTQHKHWPDDYLMDEYIKITNAIANQESELKPIKEEILRRQKESGETNKEHKGFVFSLAKERFSETWLNTNFGFELKDLPDGMIGEKVMPDVNWERVVGWLAEEGYALPEGASLRVTRKKA